jgi:UDP-GlcNAc:undecaprenyl-phosphate GlcNAc-1-phosphate transferase
MVPLVAALFGLAFLVTADLVPWVIRLARRHRFVDYPGPRKIHAEPVPYGGGLAVAAGMIFTLAAGFLGAWLHSAHGWFPWLPGDVAVHVHGVFYRLPTLLVYAMGSLAILVLGIADDRVKLPPRTKLAVEGLVALGVALGGERLEFFGTGPVYQVVITVFWIVGVTNAFNLLDHMDGLSSGVAALAGAAFLAVAAQTGQLFTAAALAALVGACAGFLVFNFPPARIFLGDAGSLFIGYWLSCLTISFTFYESRYPLYTYLVPLAILAVPLFDTACVVAIRFARRRPIFEGDTNHLAHRLTALGMSRRLAVLAVYALTVYTGVAAVLLYHVSQTGAIIVFGQLLLGLGIITLLEMAGRSRTLQP